jgi:hypothetical protein
LVCISLMAKDSTLLLTSGLSVHGAWRGHF